METTGKEQSLVPGTCEDSRHGAAGAQDLVFEPSFEMRRGAASSPLF